MYHMRKKCGIPLRYRFIESIISFDCRRCDSFVIGRMKRTRLLWYCFSQRSNCWIRPLRWNFSQHDRNCCAPFWKEVDPISIAVSIGYGCFRKCRASSLTHGFGSCLIRAVITFAFEYFVPPLIKSVHDHRYCRKDKNCARWKNQGKWNGRPIAWPRKPEKRGATTNTHRTEKPADHNVANPVITTSAIDKDFG